MHHCVQRGAYFAIRAMLPELNAAGAGEPNALQGEFSSADTVLDLPGTVKLLERHGLLDIGQAESAAEELLR